MNEPPTAKLLLEVIEKLAIDVSEIKLKHEALLIAVSKLDAETLTPKNAFDNYIELGKVFKPFFLSEWHVEVSVVCAIIRELIHKEIEIPKRLRRSLPSSGLFLRESIFPSGITREDVEAAETKTLLAFPFTARALYNSVISHAIGQMASETLFLYQIPIHEIRRMCFAYSAKYPEVLHALDLAEEWDKHSRFPGNGKTELPAVPDNDRTATDSSQTESSQHSVESSHSRTGVEALQQFNRAVNGMQYYPTRQEAYEWLRESGEDGLPKYEAWIKRLQRVMKCAGKKHGFETRSVVKVHALGDTRLKTDRGH